MINGITIHQIRLSTGDIVVTDNNMPALLVYPGNSHQPTVKLSDRKDILELRDMLIRAYPPETKQ